VSADRRWCDSGGSAGALWRQQGFTGAQWAARAVAVYADSGVSGNPGWLMIFGSRLAQGSDLQVLGSRESSH